MSYRLTKGKDTMTITETQPVEAQPVNEREQKAIEIAAHTKLTRKGNVWIVPSQSGAKEYRGKS